MGLFTSNKEPTLGEMIATRLEQRKIPAVGDDSQVWVFESNQPGADAVLSLVCDNSWEFWGGFWMWKPPGGGELPMFNLPSEYRYGVNDPLSIEIAFLEWIEQNDFNAGTGIFYGKPHDAISRGFERMRGTKRYPGW